MYCGDEVGAIVGDIGTNISRFGSSGWDTPKNIFSTAIGTNTKTNNSYVVDGSKARIVDEDIEINSPISSENIDWIATELIIRYGMENVQLGTASPSEYPLLLAENYFNTPERKEKLFELLFESIGVPASYLCHNGALSSFCFGRPTSLILDFGASETRVVPIVDGFALHRTTLTTSRGGNSIDQLLLSSLQGSNSNSSSSSKKRSRSDDSIIEPVIKPWFLCSPRFSSLSLTSSFTRFHTLALVRDIKQWMSFIPIDPSDTESVHNLVSQIPTYELPDKTVVHPSNQICLCANQIFFCSSKQSRQKSDLNSRVDDINSLSMMVWNTVLKSDVDIRRELLNNVILVGGGALIDGLSQRLANELTTLAPASIKVKVVNSMVAVEKHHAAWIGGSILSICGSFQQLWISRQEYDEYGPKVYLRKSQH